MQDGEYVYFTIQFRTTHKTAWLKRGGPLEPVADPQWGFVGSDSFGFVAEPWAGSGNGYKPQFREAYEDTRSVWAKTGASLGWWSLKYATKAIQRLRKADAEGKFDYRDNYNQWCQGIRHEYRLIKMTVSQKTEVVEVEELVDALAAC